MDVVRRNINPFFHPNNALVQFTSSGYAMDQRLGDDWTILAVSVSNKVLLFRLAVILPEDKIKETNLVAHPTIRIPRITVRSGRSTAYQPEILGSYVRT